MEVLNRGNVMFTRTLSAIILLPLLFFVLINGGVPLYLSVFIVSLIGIKEYNDAFGVKNINTINVLGYLWVLFIFIFSFFDVPMGYLNAIFFLLFIVGCIFVVMGKYTIMDMSTTFLGMIYIPYFLNHIVLIKKLPNHNYIWLIFIIAWMTDTFAYFSGYFFGKHKLIPLVSPKKTVEGSIGGVIGSIFSCVIFGYIMKFNLVHMSLVGCFGSIIAQFGDLFASAIKRYLEIKDYGKLIPGHGGILDRFDSIIFTAPFVYYYLLFFVK